MSRCTPILLLATLLAGCCCSPPAPCAPRPEAEHLYLGLRAQRVDDEDAAQPRVFLEAQVLRTPRSPTEMSADLAALGLPRVTAAAWAGRTPGKLAERAGDEVVAAPSVLTATGQGATIVVGEPAEDGFPREGLQIRVTPTVMGAEVLLRVEFEQYHDEQVAWRIPLRAFRVPDGGTLVLAAQRP